jgi:hypothetical protein
MASDRPTHRHRHLPLFAVTGVLLVLLEPEAPRLAQWAEARTPVTGTRVLSLAPQAERYLLLQYRSYRTEFMGCMLGERRGDTVVVTRIAPADVDTAQSKRTHVEPIGSCEAAGWKGTVGMIHSHPDGDKCWYFFPGTQVASSDQASFVRQPYPVDAIMCGSRVVWIARDLKERSVSLVPQETAAAARPRDPVAGNQLQQEARTP